MKKCKYKSGEKIYFLRIMYVDDEHIKIGNKEFCMFTKCFYYIDEGYIINSFYSEAIKSYLYNIENNDKKYTSFEKEMFLDKEKALLLCKKKNKYTYKNMCKELKELKAIIG